MRLTISKQRSTENVWTNLLIFVFRGSYERSLLESTSRQLTAEVQKSKHRRESKRKYLDPECSKYLDPVTAEKLRDVATHDRRHRHKTRERRSSKSHSSKQHSDRHSLEIRHFASEASEKSSTRSLSEIRTNPSKISNESQRNLNVIKPTSNSNLIAIKIEPGLDFCNVQAATAVVNKAAAAVFVKSEKKDEPLEDGECSSSDDGMI